MMKKIATALAALAVMTGLTLFSPTPAQAGTACETFHICGDFYHYTPDDGYDDPILVTCDWNAKSGNAQWVAEGRNATCHDSDGFWVGAGQTVSCLGYLSWNKYYGPSWYQFHDNEDMRCVKGLG